MAWQKTKVQFLLKNSDSGVYYARLYRDGKEIWKSLKTDAFSVAQARLAVEAKAVQQAVKANATVGSGRATVETIAKAYMDGVRHRHSQKQSQTMRKSMGESRRASDLLSRRFKAIEEELESRRGMERATKDTHRSGKKFRRDIFD
jgi:hypothetical protein